MPYILYVSLQKIYVYPLKSNLLKYCKANYMKSIYNLHNMQIQYRTVEVENKFTQCEVYA